MVLNEVDAIGPQALQRRVDLVRGFGFAAAVHLGHQVDFVAIAALVERDAHPQLASPLVVVPAIVHERDAAIDRLVNEFHGRIVGQLRFSDVEPTHADGRNRLAGTTQRTIQHLAALLPGMADEGQVGRIGRTVEPCG